MPTRHVWLVASSDGRVLHDRPDQPAAFLTRGEAVRWMCAMCSFRARIVKFVPASTEEPAK